MFVRRMNHHGHVKMVRIATGWMPSHNPTPQTHPSSWLVVGATVKGRTQADPSVDQMAGPACCWDLRWWVDLS